MSKLIVAFRTFANASENQSVNAVCSEIHIKHANTFCGLDVELVSNLVVHRVMTGR